MQTYTQSWCFEETPASATMVSVSRKQIAIPRALHVDKRRKPYIHCNKQHSAESLCASPTICLSNPQMLFSPATTDKRRYKALYSLLPSDRLKFEDGMHVIMCPATHIKWYMDRYCWPWSQCDNYCCASKFSVYYHGRAIWLRTIVTKSACHWWNACMCVIPWSLLG